MNKQSQENLIKLKQYMLKQKNKLNLQPNTLSSLQSNRMKQVQKKRMELNWMKLQLIRIQQFKQKQLQSNHKSKLEQLHLEEPKIINCRLYKIIDVSLEINNEYYKKLLTSVENIQNKTINHIYQLKYMNNENNSGFGDFLRGCYYMLYFSKMYGFKLNLIINHPINGFLKKNTLIDNNIDYSKCIRYKYSNFSKQVLVNELFYELDAKTIDFLKKHNGNENSFNLNTIVYPIHKISNEDKQIIQNMLEPSLEMVNYITLNMQRLYLDKNKYITIHVRSGDKYLTHQSMQMDDEYFNRLCIEIEKVKQENMDSDILLISDNMLLKKILISKYKYLKGILLKIVHFGEGMVQDTQSVMNTLLDFYLLSYSNEIYSFTCYKHGSGFSEWCAETYDIPYKCKLVK